MMTILKKFLRLPEWLQARLSLVRPATATLARGILLSGIIGWCSQGLAASPFDLELKKIDPAPPGSPPLLEAGAGQTAIAGRVLATDARPLAGVIVSAGQQQTSTDLFGRFLLPIAQAGDNILSLDGRHAQPSGGKAEDYGYYETRVSAPVSRTLQLPFVDWLTKIDHDHDVAIASPLVKPVVITTPAIPDLELRIPAGAVITDPDHRPVTRVGLTKISTRRPPFPLPKNVEVPVYFTAQPGGSVISSADGSWLGAQIVYPNYYKRLPRSQEVFWRYDPDQFGWAPYGHGMVTSDGRQVVPSPTTKIYAFTGAMISLGPLPCGLITICPSNNGGPSGGDPVDLGSGTFVNTHTDMTVSDIMPISVTRSYESADVTAYSFGVGMSSAYDIALSADSGMANGMTLVLPGGVSIPYSLVSGYTGASPWLNAVYQSTAIGQYYNSTITWNHSVGGWNLVRQDGTTILFNNGGSFHGIQDRYGNQITAFYDDNGHLIRVESPNGKFITFTWSSANNANVISAATDNTGRTFTYGYDSSNTMLETVNDPDGGTTTYGWSQTQYTGSGGGSQMQMTSIKDARGNTFLTNQYDGNFRVHKQTLADNSSAYTFTYTLGSIATTSGWENPTITEYNVVQTQIVDPNQNVRTLTFDTSANVLTDSRASSLVGTDIYCRAGDASLNSSFCPTISSTVPTGYVADYLEMQVNGSAVWRDTHYTYDTNANVLGITYLYGTSSAEPYTFTYSPNFNQLTSITDPLSHETVISRPGLLEEATSITDPLGHTTSFTYNQQGQVITVTDAVTPANTWTLNYDRGDLASIVDPLGRKSAVFTDALGRPIQIADALKDIWIINWDPIDGVHQYTDPINAQTTIHYDSDGNLASVMDALSHTTNYTYTSRDQLLTRQDPDLNSDQFTLYDPNGNLKTVIDRKGQTATYTYDALNRISTATYADGSVVTYTWDLGSRLTQVSDTAGNTISRFYDGANNLQCETPNAVSTLSACQAETSTTVVYTYDLANRRKTMTASGQSQVSYTFDNANRLTNIVQGSNSVIKTYDNDNRLATVTLPNSVVGTYSFDAASELTGISYAKGTTNVGTLTYTYDADGRIATRGGSLFQSVLPTVVAGATYDPDNRLCAWNTTSGSCASPAITWDNNGNVTSDGSHTYSWDARNRLIATSNHSGAYTYDALTRRLTNKTGTTTTSYVYDFANVVQEQVAGTTYANLLTGLDVDERFQRAIVGGGTTSPLVDALGSEVALANASGAVATSYAYDPYGNTTASGGGNSNPYQFTGRENDTTGLYYYRARYYNPSWGRFISEDPIGFKGGINKYAYTENNPINAKDTTGKWQFTLSGGFIFAGAVTFGCNQGQWNAGWTFGAGEGLQASLDSTDDDPSTDTGFNVTMTASGGFGVPQIGGVEVSGSADLTGEQQFASVDAEVDLADASYSQGVDVTANGIGGNVSVDPNSGEGSLGESAYVGIGGTYRSSPGRCGGGGGGGGGGGNGPGGPGGSGGSGNNSGGHGSTPPSGPQNK